MVDISVKMSAPWGSLILLSYYSLYPHLRSHFRTLLRNNKPAQDVFEKKQPEKEQVR